jgi:hypothetical protein
VRQDVLPPRIAFGPIQSALSPPRFRARGPEIAVIAILFAAHLAAAAGAQTNPFLEAGVPATSRVWTGPDYTRAAEVEYLGGGMFIVRVPAGTHSHQAGRPG